MMRVLTKQRKVIDLGVASSLGGASFVSLNEDTGAVDHVLTLEYTAWEDMGRPHRVTVTIESGDLLNEELAP